MKDLTNSMRVVSESSPTRRVVVQKITEAILRGDFEPGERLVERELCELLGVSRTSVREALRELESEGLVENIPNKGPIVAVMTLKQARGIYDMRGALEALVARLFVERASDAQLGRLGAAMLAIETAHDHFSPERFLEAKKGFYDVLLAGADNEVVAAALRSIHLRANLLRKYSLGYPGRAQASIAEMRALAKCLLERDAAGAEQASAAHVAAAAAAALEVMEGLARQDEVAPSRRA